MKFLGSNLFFISGFLLVAGCFISCEEDMITNDDTASSVILSIPLDGTLQYDSGQVILRNIATSEKVDADLTFEEDSVYAVFETITDGSWDVELHLFHTEGTVDIDAITEGKYILPVSKLIDWGRSSLFIYGNGLISLNGPDNPGIVSWLEAYHQHVNDPPLQFVQPTAPCLYNESVLYLNDQTADRILLVGISATTGETPASSYDFGHFSAEWINPPADAAKIEEGNLQFNLKDPFEGTPWGGSVLDGLDDLNDYCDQDSFGFIVRSLSIDFDTNSSADSLVVFSCRWSSISDVEGIPKLLLVN